MCESEGLCVCVCVCIHVCVCACVCVCVCVCAHACMRVYSTTCIYLRSMATSLFEHDKGKRVVFFQVNGSVEVGLAGLVDGVNGWEIDGAASGVLGREGMCDRVS